MDSVLPAGILVIPQSAIRNPNSVGEGERLRKAAQELEGVFLGLLLKAMRGTVAEGGLFRAGLDSQMYRDMFDEEIGRALARGGGIGLAQIILRDQARRQAGAGKPAIGQPGD
jgi:Rod binding domain-containing protein